VRISWRALYAAAACANQRSIGGGYIDWSCSQHPKEKPVIFT
jgi:hypothetical protein